MNNKFKFVAIPLSKEDLIEYTKNKDITYYIDYSNSTLKGEKLFSYLNNLKIEKYEIVFDNTISYTDFENLLLDYLNTDQLVTSNVLTLFLGHILLIYLDKKSIFDISIDGEYINNFINRNRDLLDKIVLFLDSSISYIERKNNIKLDHDEIDDINYIGSNIVALYLNEPFLIAYNGIDRVKNTPKYFTKQYALPMFFGYPIDGYINNYWNPLIRLDKLAITGYKY